MQLPSNDRRQSRISIEIQMLLLLPAIAACSAVARPAVQGTSTQPATTVEAPAAVQKHESSTAPATPDPGVATAPASSEIPDYVPGDWAAALLDGMINGDNLESRDSLLDAAFSAGPRIISELKDALKDDRTAEFAAQALAYISGPDAIRILAQLLGDRRDLNLRRFYYGALAEFTAPESNNALFYALSQADVEPDRTVTEAAILALTARQDPSLLPVLESAAGKIHDVVLRDDLENAIDVIRKRAKELKSPAGLALGGSVEGAVKTYFLPALVAPGPPATAAAPAAHAPKPVSAGSGTRLPRAANTMPPPVHKSAAAPEPPANVAVRRLTFSPDKSRALAHVALDTPEAIAYYDLILQKHAGDWYVASVWLGTEIEKPPPVKPQPAAGAGR
jgi:hypothetical protein